MKKMANPVQQSLSISLVYVGVATVALVALTTPIVISNSFLAALTAMVMFLTVPVNLLGLMVLAGGGEHPIVYTLLVQLMVFLVSWHLTYRYLLFYKLAAKMSN